jgi:hypothetical protein
MRLALVMFLAACGRIGFDATDDDDDGSGAGRYCETRDDVTFCDDFDAPEGAQGWNGPPGAGIAFDDIALSPPLAMYLSLRPTTMTCQYLRLDKRTLTPPVTTIKLEWAFRFAPIPSDVGRLAIAQLGAGGMPGMKGCVLFFRGSPDGSAQIYEQDIDLNNAFVDQFFDVPSPVGFDRYMEAELTMTLSSPPRFSFSLDGVPQLVDQAMRPECVGSATQIDSNMGFHCRVPSTSATEVRLDNITLTLTP